MRAGTQDSQNKMADQAAARRQDEQELVRRICAGDARALEELYDRYSGTVCALAMRIAGNRAEAEEVTQEVFWQLWKQATRFDPSRGSLSSWLFTMTRNRALDTVRARSSGGGAVARAMRAAAPPPHVPITPERTASESERARAVRCALEELPEPQRESLELSYFGGLSHAEIAAKTGEPLGTVKSRIAQAVAKLRDVLAALER
jgi:RNA polymerase sigma-70 factor (ECF subfamily)